MQKWYAVMHGCRPPWQIFAALVILRIFLDCRMPPGFDGNLAWSVDEVDYNGGPS